MLSDLRFAIRQLAKAPGFTAVAVISLALAMGANSAVFTIVNALFFRPLIPLRPAEVVNVYTARAAAERDYRAFSFAEVELLRSAENVFAEVAAFRLDTVGVRHGATGEMHRKLGYLVSGNYFSMLGVTPAAGRFFLPEESRLDAGIPVVVVSHALWESLGGGSDVAGRTVSINGTTWAIVGVTPKSFNGTNALLGPDVWLPLGMASRTNEAFASGRANRNLADPSNHALFVTARLQPGLTIEAARSHLSAMAARLSELATARDPGPRTLEIGRPSRFNIGAEPGSDGPLGAFGALLLGMSAVVLLVACLNLANMFLARGSSRAQEIAVRIALGASRARVVRLMLAEGLVVALLGGAAGLLLSDWANTVLLGSFTSSSMISSLGFSLVLDTAPDVRVLLATFAFCLVATSVFSIGPALRVTRTDARGNLSLRASETTATERWGRLFSGRHCLLMAQLALSLALLFCAGLFLRAAQTAARLDPGFQVEGDLVAELDYALGDRDEAGVRAAIEGMVDRLRAHPGMHNVAFASHVPFGTTSNGLDVTAMNEATAAKPRRTYGRLTAVSNGYFETIGVTLLRGRDFIEAEWRSPQAANVAVIDERMAAALFPGEDAVGKYLQRTRRTNETASQPIEIIGVVSAHWDRILADGPQPRIFLPLAKRFARHGFVHVRGNDANAARSGILRDQVRNELHSLDAAVPLVQLVPFATIAEGNPELWSVRFAAVLFGAFGAIALLLAVVGVYGVKALAVTRRTREFGIRIALGASPQQVLGLVIKQGAAQVVIGLSAGLLLALMAGRLLACMLLRVSPADPLVLLAATLPLAAASLLAAWLPARRATKVNPIEALRAE